MREGVGSIDSWGGLIGDGGTTFIETWGGTIIEGYVDLTTGEGWGGNLTGLR